jgi:hypothetical protein
MLVEFEDEPLVEKYVGRTVQILLKRNMGHHHHGISNPFVNDTVIMVFSKRSAC